MKLNERMTTNEIKAKTIREFIKKLIKDQIMCQNILLCSIDELYKDEEICQECSSKCLLTIFKKDNIEDISFQEVTDFTINYMKNQDYITKSEK